MSEQLKASIVRFQDAEGTIVGAGFLISEKTLLTCAHVVAQALGVSEDAPDVPIGEVQLDFPLVAPGNTFGAKLSDWRPAYPSTAIREDVAALILIGDPPDGSCSARLTRADALWGHRFRAFGFPAGYDTGVWASGVFRDQQADGWVQIEDVKQTGYFVEPGFSGAPVWDEEVNGIVGMIVAAERRTHVKAAFVFPATQLVKVLPNLADQTRHPTRLIEQRYREEVAKICCRPRLPEAFTSGLDLSRLTLASLFVRLRVRSRRSPTKLAEPPSEITDRLTPRQRWQLTEITAERSGLDSLGPLDPGLRDRIEEWLAGLTGSEPLDLAQALLRNRKLAVSGPGGSGKTTLMRWLARVCAEDRQADPVALGPAFSRRLLPIVIDLREFVSWLDLRDADSKRHPRRDLLALYIAERPEHDPACYQMLIAAIDRGEAIVLADGLDEILDRRLRERMTAFLQGFIGDEVGQRCFVVVTSRPHACPPGLLDDEIDYVELLPFRPKDVRAYLVSHWYPAAYGPALGTEAEALATEVADTPALARLAVNPLLCTLLAVIYRAGLRPLPKRRIVVFEECCKLLIHRWDEGRAIPWPQGRAEETKLSLAARLAFAALAESPDLNLAEDRARSLATEYLRNNALDCSEDEAGRAAEALLQAIRERAGLIEARGDGSYQFLIRPFLDYLAARHIAAIAAKEGEEAILDLIMPHVFDGEWRESIVMAAAHMARTADTFPSLARVLRTILDVTRPKRWPRRRIGARRLPRAGRDRWLESSLLRLEDLAVGMIGEAVGRHTNTVDELRAIARAITRRCRIYLLDGDDFVSRVAAEVLGQLVLVEPEAEEVLVEALRRARTSTIEVVARELGRPAISLKAVDALANAAGEKDTAVRKAAIEAIGMAGRFAPPVISALISATRDKKTEIRSLAITALGQAGDLSDELTELLLTYLDARDAYGLDWQSPLVCCAAAKALSSADPMTPNLVNTLVRALYAGDDKIRKAAVESLGHLASSSTSVMEALLRALEDKDWWVRCEIVRALGIASGSSKAALDAVLAATHDKVSNVRRNAIEVLRDLGIREKSAVDVLITAVSDENFWVSSMAVLALSGMGLISEDLKGRLIFERRQVYAREPGNAAFLGLTGLVPPESSDVIAEALVRLVQGKGDWRNAAMRRLGEMYASRPDLEPVLLSGLRDPDPKMRQAAADALARAGRRVPEAVPLLLADLRGDKGYEYEWYRVSAAWALTAVGTSTPEVLAGLRAALGDELGKVRRTAARVLSQFARSSEDALAVLRKCLEHKDPRVREIAVQNLTSGELWSIESPDILLRSVRDSSDSVRVTAAQMLRRALATQDDLAVRVIPYVERLTHWTSRPAMRSLLLPVLAADPRVTEPLVFDSHLNRIASGLRSVFRGVRSAAYAALVESTRDRALPSFRWYTAAERRVRRARRIWLVRLFLAVPIAFGVFELCMLYAENTYITGLATLFAFLLTVLPLNAIMALLLPPSRETNRR